MSSSKYNTPAKIMALVREIDDQIDTLKDAGLTATFIVLSLDAYTALMQYEANQDGLDQPEGKAKFRDCFLVVVTTENVVEVVPSAVDAWEGGDAFLAAKGLAPTPPRSQRAEFDPEPSAFDDDGGF